MRFFDKSVDISNKSSDQRNRKEWDPQLSLLVFDDIQRKELKTLIRHFLFEERKEKFPSSLSTNLFSISTLLLTNPNDPKKTSIIVFTASLIVCPQNFSF